MGIVTVGKAHQDAMHALRRLGLEGSPQIAVYKVAMLWPLETEGLRAFARSIALASINIGLTNSTQSYSRGALWMQHAESMLWTRA